MHTNTIISTNTFRTKLILSYQWCILAKRFISKIEYLDKIKKCYKLLEIDENSDQETVRQSYLRLAKKYHPDSGSPEADVDKFQQIDAAFRILNKKNSQDRWEVNEQERMKEFDIKHTAPQHRQYLSFDGVGIGTPAQREKYYGQVKAARATQSVLEHRLAKTTASEHALLDKSANIKRKHDIKTQYGFDRLVEDLIQESMSKGEFNNLKGSGKPLPSHQNTNPYVDFVTHKINQVLIDNGFVPEWISLQKEIRDMVDKLRNDLKDDRGKLGPFPLSSDDEYRWNEFVDDNRKYCKEINAKITHYNLVVPVLQKQMLFVSIEKEADGILKNCPNNTQAIKKQTDKPIHRSDGNNNILETFLSIFKL